MTDEVITSSDYATWLSEVKSRTQSARLVNRKLILLCWDIGRGIVEKQEKLGWGKSVVETIRRRKFLNSLLKNCYPMSPEGIMLRS